IVTSVYWDLRRLQNRISRIDGMFPSPSNVTMSDEAPWEYQADLYSFLEELPELPNIEYHLPRIGQIGDLAPMLLKVLEEYENVKRESDPDVLEEVGSLTWTGLFALVRRTQVVGFVAGHLRELLVQRYPY